MLKKHLSVFSFLVFFAACSSGTKYSADVWDAENAGEDSGQAVADSFETSGEVASDITIDAAADQGQVIADKCIDLPDDIQPSVHEINGIKVVVLKGTPYEMGKQHARFFEKELKEGVAYIKTSEMGLLMKAAKGSGMDKKAMEYSYPEIIDECRGMADVVKDWTVDLCVGLSYGDVILDVIRAGKAPKCSQFVVTGKATKDGRLLHARNLDWSKIDYLLKYPIIIVRIPDGKIPYMTVGYPGNVAPYTGINACGVSIGMNEAYAPDDVRPDGRSHNQMLRLILETCHNVDEVEAFIKSQDQASAENFGVADVNTGRVFEMSATHIGIRNPKNDVVYVTNHFESPVMKPFDDPKLNRDSSSYKRFARLHQLLDPDGKDTLYGNLDVRSAISVLRDRHDPYTGEEYGTDVFDNDSSLATNGNIYSMVFVNASRTVYLAVGKKMPVPENPYYPFTMDCLLGLADCSNAQPIQ